MYFLLSLDEMVEEGLGEGGGMQDEKNLNDATFC